MSAKYLLSSLIGVLLCVTICFAQGPDLVVKVIKDDLIKSKKCEVGVLKNGSFKNQDDKYKILSFDFYLLNPRGETKWFKELNKKQIDLSDENLTIAKGDLIVIENVKAVNIKSGDVQQIKKTNDRFLIK